MNTPIIAPYQTIDLESLLVTNNLSGSFNTTVQSFKDQFTKWRNVNGFKQEIRSSDIKVPFFDISEDIFIAPAGMTTDYLTLITILEHGSDVAEETLKTVRSTNVFLERAITDNSMLTSGIWQIASVLETTIGKWRMYQQQIANAMESLDNSGKVTYSSLVDRHSDWDVINRKLTVLDRNTVVPKMMGDVMDDSIKIVEELDDTLKSSSVNVSNQRRQEIRDSIYNLGFIFEGYSSFYYLLLSTFNCVKANEIQLKK